MPRLDPKIAEWRRRLEKRIEKPPHGDATAKARAEVVKWRGMSGSRAMTTSNGDACMKNVR
jgi:hypothetical protein